MRFIYLFCRFFTGLNYTVILNKTNDHSPVVFSQPSTVYFIEESNYIIVFPELIISDSDIICEDFNYFSLATISLTGQLDFNQEFLFVSSLFSH